MQGKQGQHRKIPELGFYGVALPTESIQFFAKSECVKANYYDAVKRQNDHLRS